MYSLHAPHGEVLKTASRYQQLNFCEQPIGVYVSSDMPRGYTITIRWNEGEDDNQGKTFRSVWDFAKFCARHIPHEGMGYCKVSYLLQIDDSPFAGIHRLDIEESMSGLAGAIYDSICRTLDEIIEVLPDDYFDPKRA